MDFKLPEIGEGLQEGELIQWLVKVGDNVDVDQPLLEVMTDKATVEVPATDPGVIKELKGSEGQMIKVGEVIAVIDRREGEATSEAPTPEPAPTTEPAKVEKTVEVPTQTTSSHENGKGFGIFAEDDKTEESPETSQAAKPYQSTQETLSANSIPAAPIVRSMADKAGVDLSQVKGTGQSVGGKARVLESDLLNFLNQKAERAHTPQDQNSTQAAPAANKTVLSSTADLDLSEETERVPLRGLRRVISKAMAKSKFTAPHYSYVDEFECSNLIELRKQAKQLALQYGVKFSYLPFIIKAVVGALKEYPVANSSLEEADDGSLTLVYKKFFHIGVAVATDDGLIVPVIKHADKKNMLEIAKEITELSEKTRAGKASPSELKGSTFTITSMGNLGGRFATPIINYPEVGILGVYKSQEKPIVKDGQIVIGNMMPLSLSLDHRVVDGAVGSMFCTAIINRLKNPAQLLMELA